MIWRVGGYSSLLLNFLNWYLHKAWMKGFSPYRCSTRQVQVGIDLVYLFWSLKVVEGYSSDDYRWTKETAQDNRNINAHVMRWSIYIKMNVFCNIVFWLRWDCNHSFKTRSTDIKKRIRAFRACNIDYQSTLLNFSWFRVLWFSHLILLFYQRRLIHIGASRCIESKNSVVHVHWEIWIWLSYFSWHYKYETGVR